MQMVKFKNVEISRRVLAFVFAGLFLISAGAMVHRLFQQSLAEKATREAQTLFRDQKTDEESGLTDPVADDLSGEELPQREVTPAMAALQEINPDVVGWIQIPETVVDYPIVQGPDNQYYLDRDWQRSHNRAGAIFMDYRNDPDALAEPQNHTILYGHHMRDGSMFRALVNYKEPGYLNDHPVIVIQDLYDSHAYEIFSVYVTTTDFYYIETEFPTAMEYVLFIKGLQKKSIHPSDVVLTAHDHVLTLSTCTYEYDDARFVVHARRK